MVSYRFIRDNPKILAHSAMKQRQLFRIYVAGTYFYLKAHYKIQNFQNIISLNISSQLLKKGTISLSSINFKSYFIKWFDRNNKVTNGKYFCSE